LFREKLTKAEIALTFRDVILLPGYTTIEPHEADVTTFVTKRYRIRIPLISSPMDTVTEDKMAIEMARLGGLGVIHRNMPVEREVELVNRVKRAKIGDPEKASLDEEGKLLVGAAISPFDFKRAKALDNYTNILVIDVAHFHNKNVIEATKRLTKLVSSDIIVGNIGTYNAAVDVITLIEDVAALRVGISSGTICVTAKVTGVGAPTLYAVSCVADALREYGLNIPIIADGGMRDVGDIVKALAGGASAIMSGYLFAGTEEAAGKIIKVNEKLYKYYRGMGTRAARSQMGKLGRYSISTKEVEEGVEGLVPYKGKLENVIKELTAGLKAGMGYVGARNIRELWEKARFALLTPQGYEEVARTHVIPLLTETRVQTH